MDTQVAMHLGIGLSIYLTYSHKDNSYLFVSNINHGQKQI